MPTWKEPAQAAKAAIVNACVRLARAGVHAILESNHHSRVERAVGMAGAVGEVLQVQESNAAAFGFLDELVAKHRRHRDFTNLPTIRRRQMHRSSST